MDIPPPYARPSGVLFDRRATLDMTGLGPDGSRPTIASEPHAELSHAGRAHLFGFESELEANLTYMPMAVRFKLDKCGIKLSLAEWQLLPAHRRRELLHAACDEAAAIANYRRALCSFVKERTGTEPATIPTAGQPPWADDDIPQQIATAAMAMGLASPSPARWRTLTALEKFALVKLSREGRDHRNLGPALREFGLV